MTAAGAGVVGVVLESIVSRRELSSSSAVSHCPERISHASFPQLAERVRSESVERILK